MSLLSAYSNPSSLGSSGDAVVFDANGPAYGADISHQAGEAAFTLNSPGIYTVDFHSAFIPALDASLPLTLTAALQQDGVSVPGGVMVHSFPAVSDTAELAVYVPVAVTSAPSTLQMVVTGGSFSYSSTAMTVRRLGDLPT